MRCTGRVDPEGGGTGMEGVLEVWMEQVGLFPGVSVDCGSSICILAVLVSQNREGSEGSEASAATTHDPHGMASTGHNLFRLSRLQTRVHTVNLEPKECSSTHVF